MTYEQARDVIIAESLDGIAYTTRFGQYPSAADVANLLRALTVVRDGIRGHDTIERQLAAALFVINDQVQGNMDGALAKGIPVPKDFQESVFPELNGLLYEIFEDHEGS